MRRVCTPEGFVAVRDADYSAMIWFPDHPKIARWLELYLLLARRNGTAWAECRRGARSLVRRIYTEGDLSSLKSIAGDSSLPKC
jgi:hypothetical protein